MAQRLSRAGSQTLLDSVPVAIETTNALRNSEYQKADVLHVGDDGETTPLIKHGSEEEAGAQKIEYGRVPRSALWLVLSTNIVMGIEYGILMPTVWEYLQTCGGQKYQLGLSLSAFSITRTLSFPLLGLWSDARGMREPFLFCFVVSIVGNFMYGVAGFERSVVLLIGGRFVAGIGGGCTVLVQAFISRSFAPSERTRLMSVFQGVNLIGIIGGPALNFLLIQLDRLHIKYNFFVLNSLTAAGYVMAAVNFLFFFLFWFRLREPPADPAVVAAKIAREKAKAENRIDTLAEQKSRIFHLVIFERGAWYCLYVLFLAQFEITALETAITPIVKDQYGWGTQENSVLFALICVVAVASLVTTIILDKRKILTNRGLLVFAYFNVAIGFAIGFSTCISTKIPLYGLGLFGLFYVYGIVMCMNPSTGIYSVKVGEFNKGVFMGYSMLVMGVARAVGPLFAGFAIHWGGTWHVLLILCAVYVLCVVGLLFMWKKMDISKELELGTTTK